MFDATTESESSVLEQLEDPAAGTANEEPSEDTGSEEEQPVETDEETVDEEETDSEEEQSEELIGGQFKSTEDLLKSYNELRRKYVQEKQQARQPQAEQPPQRQVNTDDVEAFYEAFRENPKAAVQSLIEQANRPYEEVRMTESLAKNLEPLAKEFTQMHDDNGINALFERVAEIAQEVGNPNLIRNPSPRILRMAAGELWGNESKAKVYQQAKELGRKQAEESRRQKQGVAVAVTKKPNEAPKTEADAILEGIFNAGQSGGLFG